MSKTIANTITNSLTLIASYDPLSITATGAITPASGVAIYSNAHQAWHIANAGTVRATGRYAIELQSGSTVTNTGVIADSTANAETVRINQGAGVVANSGSITGGFDGVVLTAGGVVTNTGIVRGSANVGVYISGAAGTVSNAGTIAGGVDAVQFAGSFADRLIIDPGAVFSGIVQGGSGSNVLELASGVGSGTLSGLGSQFLGFDTIVEDTGANWTLSGTNTAVSGGVFIDSGTLTNAGTFSGAITLAAGAALNNASGGIIDTATLGIAAPVAVASIGDGVTVVNAGTIAGAQNTAGVGVLLADGGTLINQSGGAISGFYGVEGFTGPDNVAVTIVNAGSISGGKGAINIANGGAFTNQASGRVSGQFGVTTNGVATVINAGSIVGVLDAVQFGAGFADRLVIDPGAVFSGTVDGGNTLGSSIASTLELAAGTAGGTFSGLGTQFVDFSEIGIDAGANWTLAGSNSLATRGVYGTTTISGGTVVTFLEHYFTDSLTDYGTLTNTGTLIGAGVTVATGGVLINAGGTISDTAKNAGIKLQAGASLANQAGGTITALDDPPIDGIGGGVTILNAGVINTANITNASLPAIVLADGGSVSNLAGGTINSTGGIYATGAALTVTNAGLIASGNLPGATPNGVYYGAAISLAAGGAITNLATGRIRGSVGILATAGATTVVNAGTIQGGVDDIVLAAGFANRVVVDPGAVFGGTVDGGNTLGSAVASTLELTSAATAGTLSGLGTQFVDFAQIDIDSGANWTLSGAGTIGAGATLLNAGALSDAGTLLVGGTMVNSASIGGSGITLTSGGVLNNAAGGTITAAGLAVAGTGGASTVTNAGTIIGNPTSRYAVELGRGGSVVNTGAISNANANAEAVRIDTATGTVTNSGSITGGFDGVVLTAGGVVTNTGIVRGSANVGVYISGAAGTVSNAGTIAGGVDAVQFAGSFADRLIIDPGAVFSGTVDGGNTLGSTVASTLELAAGSVGVTGTLSGFGAQFVDFGRIVLDDAARWEIDGASAGSQQTVALGGENILALGTPGSFGDAITGFDITDALDLTGLAFATGATATLNGQTLTVSSGGIVETFNLQGVAANTAFKASDDEFADHGVLVQIDAGNSGKSAACYCRGTLILTERGEVAVEELAIGDLVMTRSGTPQPIRWIGRRSYAGWLVAGNPKVMPICFMPGALADGVPRRELRVSPEHAMYLDDALVPAGLLVNGISILPVAEVEEVHYIHLEFAGHEIIEAEGAAAESFVDDDSRGMFHNAAEFHAMYPDASRSPATFCAPRIEDGFALEALRCRLAGRAMRLRADGTAAASDLQGSLDHVSHALVSGWAFDPAAPDVPVVVSVLANGAEIGRVVADGYRRDLERAGFGTGCCGFSYRLPSGLAKDARHEIELRTRDGRILPAAARHVVERLLAAAVAQPQLSAREMGRLCGQIDQSTRLRITGWAQDAADGESPVGLAVSANGRQIGRMLANTYREDLATAGLGSGRHAFDFLIPGGLSAFEAHEIRVWREADGAELGGSPICLPAATDLDAATEAQFTGLLERIADPDCEERALTMLMRETEALLGRRAARQGGKAELQAAARFRRRHGVGSPGVASAVTGTATKGHDAAARPSALVIDLAVPCASRDAGSVAILSHVRGLLALGYAVSFVASDEMARGAALSALAAREGLTACSAPHYGCVEDVLRLHEGSFDVIYLHRHETADRYLSLARRHCPRARIVYSVADLHHIRLARQAQVERRPELLRYSRHIAAVEFNAARRADIVLTHSQTEAALLRQAVGFRRVQVVPFSPATRAARRGFAERYGLAFVGSIGHAPNTDAVHHLRHDIMPLIWQSDPSLTCRIIGHGWLGERRAGWDPRIEVVGPVDDLSDALALVRLTVAPLRFGAGIKGKVLDSFAAGLPCVMSPIAAEGIALGGGLSDLVAATPAAFAALALRLHGEPEFNARTGRLAARLAADSFDQAHVTEALRAQLQPATAAERSAISG